MSYTHLVNLPPAEAALMHILNDTEVKKHQCPALTSTSFHERREVDQ